MKVQVVQLEPQDDQVSARDKLAWAKSPRVLLVWPDHGRILNRQLDLILLQRQAQRQRSQLGLVTRDSDVREQAALVGLPVFESPDRIPERGWRRNKRRPPRSTLRVREARSPRDPPADVRSKPVRLPRTLRAALAILALVSLSGAALVVLPSARLILTPALSLQMDEFTFPLVSGTGVGPDPGSLPALRLTSRFQGELRLPSHGRVSVPATFAEGEVVFVNLLDEALTVPAGLTVRPAGREDLFFATLETFQLEAGEGEQASAGIRASVGGEIGNIPAGQISAVDGPLGLKVGVSNPLPTAGGSSRWQAAPSAADRRDLRQKLEAQLLAQADDQWRTSLPVDSRLAPGTAQIQRVIKERFSAEVGEPADSHALSLEVEIVALAYQWSDLELAAAAALDASLKENQRPVPETLRMEIEDPVGMGSSVLRVGLSRQIYDDFDRSALTRSIAGKRVEDALPMVEGASSFSTRPVFRVWPTWFPTLPILSIRIDMLWPWEAD